jgi:AcrR family transcriptional regulator
MAGNGVTKAPRAENAQTATASAVARPARQKRGQARVDVLLDTAAAMIAEEGLAGVSMHAVARRAQTSIGSLYHFFPDRDSVLDALSERHRAAMREITRQQMETPASVWQQLSPGEAIGRLVTPYFAYLRAHADYLPLMHDRTPANEESEFIHSIRLMVDARLSRLAPTEREACTTLLHAVGAGTLWMGFRTNPERLDIYLQGIPRVMAAYLADMEATPRKR